MNKPRRLPRRAVHGVLLLDKPAGMSSNAALQKARGLFNAEKAGHTGTLDPLATGLLPVCFGEATKFAGELLDAEKSYRATVRLGVVTDTADAEGRVLSTCPVESTEADLHALLPRFTGALMQLPPMYSALKREGVPLYVLARQGVEVARTPRRITIHALRLIAWRKETFDLEIDCSKGTYVRTLAADIGAALGCGAHLEALRRTRVGALDLKAAVTLDHLAASDQEGRDTCLLPADALLAGLPTIMLDATEAGRVRQGQGVRRSEAPSCRCRLFGPEGFIGLGEGTEEGWIVPKRLIGEGTMRL